MTMRRTSLSVTLLTLTLLVACPRALFSAPPLPGEDEPGAWWVFFDRRDTSATARRRALAGLDAKALERRRRSMGRALLAGDLPPHPADLAAVLRTGAVQRAASRWLNAISVIADPAQREAIRRLPHVREVRPVARGRRVTPPEPQRPARAKPGVEWEARGVAEFDSTHYGAAWYQDALIGVPEAHAAGYTGAGVRIGFLDSGFIGVYDHQAFANLVIAGVWNAIDGSEAVETHDHGTKALSVTVADAPRSMVGVAPDAEVLLVRTEDASDEYPAEEDYWVAGLEWAETHGADLVSTSLGYSDWYEGVDFDGNTAVTTVAADAAAARGLLVISSAGNRGSSGLVAPGDGDSVLAVGAVNRYGEVSGFSSRGPTADGRVKPDVAAMGEDCGAVDPYSTGEYLDVNGTSFSCPATSGAAALLLQANPNLSPVQLIVALRATASQAFTPDFEMGYGIIDIPAALVAIEGGVAPGTAGPLPGGFRLVGVYPNPTNGAAVLRLKLASGGSAELALCNLLGREVMLERRTLGAGEQRWTLSLSSLPSGTYLFAVRLSGVARHGRVVLVK